jgi:hypothetical protein
LVVDFALALAWGSRVLAFFAKGSGCESDKSPVDEKSVGPDEEVLGTDETNVGSDNSEMEAVVV